MLQGAISFATCVAINRVARQAAVRLQRVTCSLKGRFPVMAEITRILAANICRQFFFVINTAASTRCLVQNFQLTIHNTSTVVVQDVQNGRTIGWLQW